MLKQPSSVRRFVSSAIALVAIGTGYGAAAPRAVAPAPEATTVWDRVFSEAQAARGQAQYKKSCTVCHRDDLSGSDGPPLTGIDFFIRWREHTVAEMLDEIQMTMPQSDPGSLSPQTYLDILGFLFKFNGVPTGTTDLVAEPGALAKVAVTEKPKH
ncbi:MAG TPA: cytochrome c [Vicinamibacterales bacterium]|nr:cytochrome c [Vicinamibacterales bacterium]